MLSNTIDYIISKSKKKKKNTWIDSRLVYSLESPTTEHDQDTIQFMTVFFGLGLLFGATKNQQPACWMACLRAIIQPLHFLAATCGCGFALLCCHSASSKCSNQLKMQARKNGYLVQSVLDLDEKALERVEHFILLLLGII